MFYIHLKKTNDALSLSYQNQYKEKVYNMRIGGEGCMPF